MAEHQVCLSRWAFFGLVCMLSPVMGDNGTQAAEDRRLESLERAQGALGYQDIPDRDQDDRQSTDYRTLQKQIAELARLVGQLRHQLEEPDVSHPPILGLSMDTDRIEVGPKGATVALVEAYFRYRLLVTDNPRLKLGPIGDKGSEIEVEILTVDGSLVDRYRVDKRTGVVEPVH